ncbi:hypothetical protein [Cellulomonas iranensis]|uniref:hypothetical protein n=1 Tax=Cellulomonas iranensis TaxID=76862 RepID=UPI003D7D4BE6
MKTGLSIRRAALVVAVALAAGTAAALPAAAYNTPSYWNTAGAPLQVSGYGSTARAYGYIKIFNGSNGTRLHSYAWNKFTDADNHAAYLNGKSQFNAGTCREVSVTIGYKGVQVAAGAACAQTFYDGEGFRQDGLNYTTNSWVQMANKSTGVHSGADRGRAAVRMAIDIPLRPDVESGPSYSDDDSW